MKNTKIIKGIKLKDIKKAEPTGTVKFSEDYSRDKVERKAFTFNQPLSKNKVKTILEGKLKEKIKKDLKVD